MPHITTITQKGQVTIPAEIRKYLGIEPRTKILFSFHNEHVVISPAHDFMNLRGSVKSKKKYSDEKADKEVLSYIKKQYEKK